MKKILFLTVILVSLPTFAACPIDGDACVAEFQSEPLPMPAPINPKEPTKPNEFVATPSTMDISREIKPAKNREFRSNNTEYGYNSSCQFGVCMDTGTPKNFTDNPQQ